MTFKKNSNFLYSFIIIWVILSFGATFLLFRYYNKKEYENSKEKFNDITNSMNFELKNKIILDIDMLFAMQVYMNNLGVLNRANFEKIGHDIIKDKSELISLQWISVVKGEDRETFEKSIIKEGFKDFYIKDLVNGKSIVAPKSDIYFPVNYIVPFASNKVVFGFDPGKRQLSRFNSLMYSYQNNLPSATNHFNLVQNTKDVKSFLLYLPVKNQNEVIGFVGGIFRIETLINAPLKSFFKGYGVSIKVFENNVKNERVKIGEYGTNGQVLKYYKTVKNIQIANHNWEIEYYANSQFEKLYLNKTSNYVLLLGAIISIFFTLVFIYVIFDNKKEIVANNKSLLALTNSLSESNYELNEINAIASHDLRSPANSIKSLIDLIYIEYQEKYKHDVDFFELLDMIKLSNERMLSVVNDVMDYTMIGSERVIGKIDVDNLINDIKVDLKVLLDKNQASIITKQKLPTIFVYSTEFRLLLQNLINNGIKFHKKDVNPTIDINYSEDNEFYHFIISDNGIGIPANNLENVFKMFKRGSNSSEFDGTGVGLSHCKKIVSQHKGTIWIESEVNIGTQVHFTIAKDLS